MTEKRDDTVRDVTIHEAFQRWGDYITEQEGPGDVEEGWARLRLEVAQTEQSPSRRTRSRRWVRRAITGVAKDPRVSPLETIFVGCVLLVVAVVISVCTTGGWWLIPAGALLGFLVEKSTKGAEAQWRVEEKEKDEQEAMKKAAEQR